MGPIKRVMLDTTALIDLLRRRPAAVAVFRSLVQNDFEITTSAINVGEVYACQRRGEEGATLALLGSILCFDLTRSGAQRAGEMVAARRRAG